MPDPSPLWSYCPQEGMSRSTKLAVDQNNFGDGYTERATRGLNPARPSWTASYPFVGVEQLAAMEEFLVTNAARGFYMKPPDLADFVFVTVDEWSATVSSKNNTRGIVGSLQLTLTKQFNPQPLSGP